MGPLTIIFHFFHNIHKNIAMTTFTPRHSTLFWELIWALNAANSSASIYMWSNWISMGNRLAVWVSSMAAFSFSNIITRHIFQALALATYLILYPFSQHCRQCPWPYCLNFWLSFGSLRQYFGLVRFMVDLSVPFQLELVGWVVGWWLVFVDVLAFRAVIQCRVAVPSSLLPGTSGDVVCGWFYFVGKFKFCIANRRKY